MIGPLAIIVGCLVMFAGAFGMYETDERTRRGRIGLNVFLVGAAIFIASFIFVLAQGPKQTNRSGKGAAVLLYY